MHTALTECAPMRAIWGNAVIEPTGDQLGVGVTASALSVGQADQLGDGVGVAGQQPCRGTGLTFGVVLPQPAAGTRQILGACSEAVAVSM